MGKGRDSPTIFCPGPACPDRSIWELDIKFSKKNKRLYSNVKNLIISLFPKYSLKKIKFSGPFRSTETFGTKIILLNSLSTRFKKIWVYNYATFVAYSPAKIVSIKRNPSICNFLTQPCFAEPRSARD